jgi:hypothetical protein
VLDDQDVETGPERCLEEALDIVGYLVKLLPALRDPLEEDDQDSTTKNADGYSVDAYRHLATVIFPEAPKALVERLGESNWRRAQNMQCLRDRLKALGDQTDSGQPIENLSRPRERSRRRPWDPHRKQSRQHQSTRADSDAGASTAQSNVETILSRTLFLDQNSATSVTESHQNSILEHLVPPKPPVDLGKVEQFDCPYCHFELPLTVTAKGMDIDEWTAHVYLDLKPYMCTFDNCNRDNRPFGVKEEWFRHELDFHRSQMVWFCGVCRTDFETENDFRTHLQSSHGNLASDNQSPILDNCKRYSQKPLSTQNCALCGVVYSNIEELKNHLGKHLETFALAAALDNDPSDEEGSEGDEILDEYIAEQHELHRPSDDAPLANVETYPATLPKAPVDTDASRIVDTSDPLNLDEIDKEARRQKDDLWAERVQTFLDKQTAEDYTPPIRSNVPARYENFVGRGEDLLRIHEHLSTPGRICTVSGRGGVGKTATAVEYLYLYDAEYSYVFWVEAETPGACADKFSMIATFLLGEKPLPDENARIFFVRECLARAERRWLLIFDNVPARTDISRYIPRSLLRSKGSVLITTRSGPLSVPPWHHQHAVELEVFCLEHGRVFMLC